MFSLLTRIFVRNSQAVHLPYVQLSYIRLVSWSGIFINVILGGLKVGFGLLYGTVSLVSDGIDSFSNVLSSLILIISYKTTASPESLERPFGAGRAVYIASFSIALLVGFTGFQLALMSIEHLALDTTPPIFGNTVLYIVICSLLVNEWQARFCFYAAKKIHSEALQIEGVHRRSDNYFSLSVIIAWGASFYGLHWVDGAVGIFFGGIILHSAYSIAKKNIRELLGTPPPKELIENIVNIGNRVPGIIGIHEIVVHRYGEKSIASMHVEINENLNLRDVHLICDQLEDLLRDNLHIYAITHADPSNVSSPFTAIIGRNKEKLLGDPYIQSYLFDIGHIYVREDRVNPSILFVSLDLFLKRPLSSTEEQNFYSILKPRIEFLLGREIRLKLRPRPLFGTNVY